MKPQMSLFATCCFTCFFSLVALAQIPRTLSYQGVLTDASGNPLSDGVYSFTFRLYEVPTGGASIWTEQKSLEVKRGLFSTALGDAAPFGASVKFDKPYWLGIQVGNEPELSPRIPLTSVGYSLSSLRADTASVSVASLADTTWRHSGINIYRLNGGVGIGTATPTSKLDVAGKIKVSDGGFGWVMQEQQVSGQFHFNIGDLNNAGNPTRLAIDHNGNVGIGTTAPTRKLEVVGEIKMSGSGRGWLIEEHLVSGQHHFSIADLNNEGNPSRLVIDHNGNVGIGTITPSTVLDVAGITTTKILAITGGSDLAEPFEISENQPISKGALVIIDDENPGRLKLSHQAYDKRVAGVVSGAGGINPGLTLTQEGVLEGGQNVTLSGRVYALATTANGPIKPGDLLTTSDIPGHTMKATDRELWPGAVIGKAMSNLENGEGLVLVLVNLQ